MHRLRQDLPFRKGQQMDDAKQIALRIAGMMRQDGFEPPAGDSLMPFVMKKLEQYIIWLRENQSKYIN